MDTRPKTRRKDAEHWKRLRLIEGAPSSAIKAAHRHLIGIHHPDRGGEAKVAQQINVARDALLGRGAETHVYIARHYDREPWQILGVIAGTDSTLAAAVAKALLKELPGHERLAERVRWAQANYGKTMRPGANGARPVRAAPPPAPPRRPQERTPREARRERAAAGPPDGLPQRIDFGTLYWGTDAAKQIKLTWRENAPHRIDAAAAAPLRVTVTASRTLPGRFLVELSVDWTARELARAPSIRGYSLESHVVVRWSGGETAVPVRGVLLYPPVVSVSPQTLDLGTRRLQRPARASMMLISTAPTEVRIETPAFLARAGASGRPLDSALRLAANTPVRVEFAVVWQPIVERGEASIARGRSLRPTGRITVRWGDQRVDVPVQMIVETR